MTARSDFRVRKLPGSGDDQRFRIEQFEAGRWVPLYAQSYPSRQEALRAIDGFVT
ncbi:hypothetical protein [Mycolicibacterium elephantis]|uniref:hypothetical protein n=1 Tax=Mycolicibacterium elephantis TaxID=81858 RepID=UPI000B2B020E|nr:hypothetical protein [Mycolicibacterium elephantis]